MLQFSKCCPTQARPELQLAFIHLNPFLTARTGTTDPELVRLFKEQIACLNFSEDFHSYDGTAGELSAATRWSCCAAFSSLIKGVYYAGNRDAAFCSPLPMSLFSFFQSCVLKPAQNEQQMRHPRINSLKSSTLFMAMNKMRFWLINANTISHSIYSLQKVEEFT